MDTLFRLVTFQSDQSSRTSSSSRSSKQNPNYHDQEQDECFNLLMAGADDEADFSSSSYNPPPPPPHHHAHHHSAAAFSPSPDVNLEFASSLSGHNPRWAHDILLETAKAMADGDTVRVQHLMWILNEMGSPYGDPDQKLASYFLQALFTRMTDAGDRNYKTLTAAFQQNASFESTRRTMLKFQEVSPWATFGHVACNGAIMEAFENENKLHIIDISNTYCTQWPTLLEAIATRAADETPHLKLTAVGGGAAASRRVMREIGTRMEKFARLMGVPFEFNAVHHDGDLTELDLGGLVNGDETVAVNCNGTLRSVTVDKRDDWILGLRRLGPRIVTVIEEEADLDLGPGRVGFVNGFGECLRWFRVYFEALDESFVKTSNERLMLERAAGRAITDLVACPPERSVERRETAARWEGRMHGGGFGAWGFSEEVCDDVRALLRRYKEGWSMATAGGGGGGGGAGIFLSWKDQPVVWASAWKLN